MKRFLVGLVSVFVIQGIHAEEIKDFGKDRLNKSPRHADWVDIKSGGQRNFWPDGLGSQFV